MHAAQWVTTLETYAEPVLGQLSVQAINTPLVRRVLEPLWSENPARWHGHIEKLLPKRSKVQRFEHHAALPYGDLPQFMTALRGREGTAARSLEFAILTCARTGEVNGLRWPEIDFGEKLWTVPAERMKAEKKRRVPLSADAIAILEKMTGGVDGKKLGDGFVFPGAAADNSSPSAAAPRARSRFTRFTL